MTKCDECGKLFDNLDGAKGDCCSRYCWDRSYARGMDGYDVDDPDNPAYSNNASYSSNKTNYSSNKTNGCLGDIIAIAVVLIGILLGSWLL